MKGIKFLILVIFVLSLFQFNLYSLITSRVEGTVIDKDTGQPIKGAYVALYGCDEEGVCSKSGNVKTDNNGFFKFDDLKRRNYFLVIVKEGYAFFGPLGKVLNTLSFIIKANIFGEFRYGPPLFYYGIDSEEVDTFYIKEGQIKHFKIKLKKEAKLIVNVKRKKPQGIEPVPRVSIGIKHSEYIDELDVTAKKGHFESHYFDKGTAEIEILVSGYPDKTYKVQLENGKTTNIDYIVDFTKGQVVYGVIRDKDDGGPVPNVYIYLTGTQGAITDTDDNGEFWIGGLKSGTYILEICRLVYSSSERTSKNKCIKKQFILRPNEKKELNFMI
jgi:hypothetical protein